jgi:tetratricopeptide (TPR) repeat protein
MYKEMGYYERVIADYTQLIKIYPNNEWTLFNPAIAYYDKGDYESALSIFTEMAMMDSPDGDVIKKRQELASCTDPYNTIGLCYRAHTNYCNGNYDSAIADFTAAIETEPHNVGAYNNRGMAHEKKGDRDSAIADYTRAIEINPNYADALGNRGRAYRVNGDFDSAIADCERAIEINPDNAIARENLELARGLLQGKGGKSE